MNFKIKHVANCPACLVELKESLFSQNNENSGLITYLYSCLDKNCRLKYSHLTIRMDGHLYNDLIWDREIYVKNFKIIISYYNNFTIIKKLISLKEENNSLLTLSLIDFNYSDIDSIKNKLASILVFA